MQTSSRKPLWFFCRRHIRCEGSGGWVDNFHRSVLLPKWGWGSLGYMMIVPIITSGQLSRGDCSESHRFSQRMPFRSFLAPLLKKALLRTEPKRCVSSSRWAVSRTSWAANTPISPHPQLFFLSRLWWIVLIISVGPVQTQRGCPLHSYCRSLASRPVAPLRLCSPLNGHTSTVGILRK